MPQRRIKLSKDKIEFLENWKREKYNHLQDIMQHTESERKLKNHSHSIDPLTQDIVFTALTLLPLEVAKRVLSECTLYTCYLSDYQPGHFFHKSEISGYHMLMLFFPHGESIPKYWSYINHHIAHYVLGHFDPGKANEMREAEEAEASKLACKWVSESPYLVPRNNFDHCSCPPGTIAFCRALATST